MKQNKIFRFLSASLSLLFVATGAAACNGDPCSRGHAYVYTVKTPATCVSEGVREVRCNVCGEVYDEAIPVDENAHDYGDWAVVNPTETATGSATKTCSRNAAHTLTQSLPVLSDEAYAVKVVSEPSSFEKGETRYTYAHAEGNIVFTVETDETGVNTVADAVDAAVAHKKQVRKGTAEYTPDLNASIWEPNQVTYEFGDRYAHIYDEGAVVEEWYSWEEDGNFYGVRWDGTRGPTDANGFPLKDENGKPIGLTETNVHPLEGGSGYREEAYLDGFVYTIYYVGLPSATYYGAENFAYGLYDYAKRSNAHHFAEKIVERDGVLHYVYSFDFLDTATDYFSVLELDFTLSDTYALKTLEFNAKVYRTYDSWEDNGDGTGELLDAEGEHWHVYLRYDQTLLSELSEEELAAVPTNPYGMTTRKLQSFKLTYHGVEASETQVPDAQTNIAIQLSVSDVKPELFDFKFDPIVNIYHVVNGRDILLGIDSSTTKLLAHYSDSSSGNGTITIRSWLAGELTFVAETQSGFRKTFKINFTRIAPSSLTASAYEVSALGNGWNNNVVKTTVYTGQPLLLRALVADSEKDYADASVTATTTAGATFTETEFLGEKVVRFLASESGTYTVTLTSKRSSVVKTTLSVEVLPAPTPAEMFAGNYEANVTESTLRGTVRLEITPSAPDGKTGTMTLIYASGDRQTLDYTYVENADPILAGTLTTTHAGGIDDEYQVSVTLNEAYMIELNYTTKFDERATVVFVRASD